MRATLRTKSSVLVLALSTVLSSCWLSHERDECPPGTRVDAEPPVVCTTPAEMLRWTTSTPAGAGALLFDVGGASREDLWVVGTSPSNDGVVLRNVGGGWRPIDVPVDARAWVGVLHTSATDIWLAADGTSAHFDGIDWNEIELDVRGASITALWQDCASRVWIAADAGRDREEALMRVVSHVPRRVVLNSAALGHGWGVNAIWGTGPRDVWLAGFERDDMGRVSVVHPRLLRGDETSWTNVGYRPDPAVPGLAQDVWGTADDDVWVAGADLVGPMDLEPTLDHWDGTSWSRVELPDDGVDSRLFVSVWGTSPVDVWVLDLAGPLFHFDGSRWALIAAPTFPIASRLQGFSPDPCHVFIVDGDTIVEGAP